MYMKISIHNKINNLPTIKLVDLTILNPRKKRVLTPHYARRDMQSWEALAGILKGKKAINAVKWQKEIRKEWERKLPKLNNPS